jgi:hypothetical protein
MTSQTKNDDDEPPFVLQNCSVMSRQVATAKEKQSKRGWGLGWFGGTDNVENKNNDNATGGKNRKKVEKTENAPKINKSLLPSKASSTSSSSVAQPTTHSKNSLHPPSPKSLSPRYSSPGVNSSMVSEKSFTKQSSEGKATQNNDNDNGIANGGKSPNELSLKKRREEVRQTTAWYEEYIRDQLVKHGGKLSSLNKDDLVALGLFDKQRRLNRRIELWGRRDSDAELQLTDDELEQLLVLANRSKQAQIDETELEMLLVQMENNNEVDMDRLYILELLSRQRVGEILNEKELDALEISEEKKQDKEDVLDLLGKKEDGKITDDVDELRLRELTLLERKRNSDKSMTNEELHEIEIIEMRREDARLNKKDYNKLLRLKERGEHLDEDRFNLLSLLDRRRRSAEISESESEILEQYFALREEEYLDRIESTIDLKKKDRHDKRITDTEQILEPSLLKRERQGEALADKEKQQPDKLTYKKESIYDKEGENSGRCLDEEELNELLGRKERGEQINENRLHELELIHRQQCGDVLSVDELIDNEKVNDTPKKSEAEDDNETKSASTVDEAGMSFSERSALEELRGQLKKQGLPLAISFAPFSEDDESNMSGVSFSDETYVRDLIFQKENRESERKEECLEDAYKLYKRTIKKQKLPENEEMLLTMFAKILQKRNKEMRKADKQFDKLVEAEVSFHELRKQEAQNETIKKKILGQRGSELLTNEEMRKSNINTDSQNERKVKTEIEVEKKCTLETMGNPPINVADDDLTTKKDPEQSTLRGWGMGLFGRSASNITDGDWVSQAEISEATDDESRFSKQTIETQIEQMPGNTENEGGNGVTKDEEVSDVRDGLSLRETNITEDNTQSVEDSAVEKAGDKLLKENKPYNTDLLQSTQNINIDNGKGTKGVSRAKELTNEENRSEYKPSKKEYDTEHEEFDVLESKPEGRLKSIENVDDIKAKAGDILTPGIENDLLFELELVTRVRKGIHLTDRQNYELDLLLSVRRGGTLSEEELDDFKLLKRKRGQIALNDAYLRDLYDRSSRGQPVNDNLLYEIELFHKDLSGETLSDDEQTEIYLFARRLNGDVLTEDHLEELDFLRNERLSQLPTDHHSDDIKEHSINGRSIGPPTDHHPVGKIERSIDDEDSIYRQELLGRQKAGKRLDKKEFQWLQILMKKAQDEELDEDDLHELEIMRNQRNETEVDFVNTKKLLEEELKRQHKKRMKEQRRKERKEKEERREQRRERGKVKKMRRTNRSRSRDDAGILYNAQTGIDEKNDAVNSHDAKNEFQIIGSPSLQHLRPEDDKKEAPVMGVFGGVFGMSAKKRRQEQQLEEAKRLQGELIKEQMKALSLGNEAEELDREKVMQQQLVQETIEKKRADSTVGSSSWDSNWDCNWDSSTAEKFEESDASSWSSSWDSSLNEDSSKSEEVNEIQENEKQNGKKVDRGLIENPAELSKPVIKEVASLFSNADSNIIGTSQVLSALNGDLIHSTTDNGKDQILPDHPDRLPGENISGKIGSREKRRPKSGDLKTPTGRSSLGFHLKKRKKKRTKDDDEVSLGTLQLSKTSKEDFVRSKERPWITNDPIVNDPVGNSIKSDRPDITQNGDLVIPNENSISENNDSFQFKPSHVSRISEGVDEDEEEPVSIVYSDTEEDRDVDEKQVSVSDAEQSLRDSLANSLTSIGQEAYDLGLQEYENIESRLGEKVLDKQAEFDLTWETTEADENVIAQINQRLRERQRVIEVKREKKKEKKERKKLQEVPRLFLFEGERVAKNGRKSKKKNKSQKKLNKTLTKEFRKAMKEIFDSDSDPGDDYRIEMEVKRQTDNEDKKDDNNVLIPPFSPKKQITDDDGSDALSYSEIDADFVEESNKSDEESVQFDGEYLTRLQARSMPVEVKRMLSGRHIVSGRDLTSSRNKGNLIERSDGRSFTSDGYLKGRRRPRRKKTGEIVNDNIDPAEVYAQELEKQKGKKTFTITELRKEIEDMKRGRNFAGESDRNFGNFDDISPSPLNQSKVKPNKTKKKKKVSLGRGIESLERQRPRLATARSMRSFGTTFSDQGLLTGNRRARRRETMPATIEEDNRDEGGGVLMASVVNSDGFDKNEFVNENSGKEVANTKLPNLKLFGAFKKTFKTKKPAQFENAEGGGLLNGAQNDGFEIDESFPNVPSFEEQGPLPLPAQDGNIRYQRTNKRMLKKMNMKGVLSKLKLPGNNLGNRKFGGGIMMDDDA